jgi:hypothetical protein
MGIRTPDIQLAKLTLYQLSYTPERNDLKFEISDLKSIPWVLDEVKTNLCSTCLHLGI